MSHHCYAGHSATSALWLCIIARSALSAYCGEPQYAEFEHDLIQARTTEGRERAKARGVKLGRPFKLTSHQHKEARGRRGKGEMLMDIARSYNVSHSTISRLSA